MSVYLLLKNYLRRLKKHLRKSLPTLHTTYLFQSDLANNNNNSKKLGRTLNVMMKHTPTQMSIGSCPGDMYTMLHRKQLLVLWENVHLQSKALCLSARG